MSRNTGRQGGTSNSQRAKYNQVKPGGPASRPNRQGIPTRQNQGKSDDASQNEPIDRETYHPPTPGYDTKAMRQFREYLETTELETTFRNLLLKLLNRSTFPYNPYPGFVLRFRQYSEKFHMNLDSDEKIRHTLGNLLKECYMPNLFSVRGHDSVWGLSSILRAVSPTHLEKYKWLLEDLTPHPEDVYSTVDYSTPHNLMVEEPHDEVWTCRLRTRMKDSSTADSCSQLTDSQTSDECRPTDSQGSNWSQGEEAETVKEIQLADVNMAIEIIGRGQISPLRSKLHTDLMNAKDRTVRYYKRKADVTCTALYEAIAPCQGEKLKRMSTHNLETTDDDLFQVVGEMFNNLKDSDVKCQLLSLVVNKYSKAELLAQFPQVTKYQIDKARRHAYANGPGTIKQSATIQHRQRMNYAKLQHAVEFFSDPTFNQISSYTTRDLKLDSGETLVIPDVVRTVIHSNLIKLYNSYCSDNNVEPLSDSTLYEVLKACGASRRKCLRGLDNIAVDGSCAYDSLISLVDKFDKPQEWKKDMKNKFLNSRLYLKTDYRLHIQMEDECAFHCLQYALSDPKNVLLSVACSHQHKKVCSRCNLFGETVAEVRSHIAMLPIQEQEILQQDLEMSIVQVEDWRSHILRTVNQDSARLDVLNDLKSNEVLLIMDWAMKYLPHIYREKMKDFFGQKGVHWHVCVAVFKDPSGNLVNQVMVALVGPVVFEGTFYPQVHSVQLRMEHLVTGPDVKQGVTIFVNTVMANIDAMYANPKHLILGVNIPKMDEEYTDIVMMDFWDADRIQNDKEDFLQVLSDTVIANKYINMECIFRVDPFYPRYMRGQIQYGLNFIEITQDDKEEGLSSFCEFPMASLHEGVFLNRSHAEQYISVFQPQVDSVEERTGGTPSYQPPKRDQMLVGATPNDENRTPSRNRKFSAAQDRNLDTVRKHVHDTMKHIKPYKVLIDGFKLGDDQTYGPYAWQITTPIKSYLQKKIAGYHMQAELCEAVYCGILLYLLDRESYSKEFPFELYRLLHSTVGRLYLVMEQNKSLRYIIKGFSTTQSLDVIQENLALYREAVKFLFESNLHERSREQQTMGKVIGRQIDDFLPSDGFSFESLLDVQVMLKMLKNINWYCMTLYIQLAEDCLSQCPSYKKVVQEVKTTFPEVIQKPITRHRQRRDPNGADHDLDVQHGIEHEHMRNLVHEKLVISVDDIMQRNSDVSQVIAKEGVLLQYMLDTHLDETYHSFLLELVTGGYFPPNPYPRFVSHLRQQAMKMDLFFEKPEQTLESLYGTNLTEADADNCVYTISGVDCYGTQSALRLLDTVGFVPLSQVIQMFVQRNYIQRKGTYRVGICLALSGPSILYGKVQPYLNEVEIHEHYYIQGPPGGSGGAINLFSTLVQTHLTDMVMKNMIPVMGVYFGETRWSWEDIITRKQGLLDTILNSTARKEPIFLKAFILLDQWRYVPVRKYFLLHFLTDDDLETEIFYPDNPIAFYQSVFLAKDRAAFHYQNGGPIHGGDPMNGPNVRVAQEFLDRLIGISRERCDWMTVHRGLLLKSLLNQDNRHVLESWQVLHSMAGLVEYIVSMIDTLQDLLVVTMESHEYSAKLENFQSAPNTQESQARGRSQQTPRSRGQSQPQRQLPMKRPLPVNAIADFECTIDEAIFGKMTMVFHGKIMEICNSRIFMSGTALSDYIHGKLKLCIEEDPRLNNFYFAYNNETLYRLEEIKHMMKTLQDSLAADTHSICPRAEGLVDDLEVDYFNDGRPSSVASYMLNDPYRPRPQAHKMQTVLE